MDVTSKNYGLHPQALVVRGATGSPCFAINRRNRKIINLNDAAFAYLFLLSIPNRREDAKIIARKLPNFVSKALECGILEAGELTHQGRIANLTTTVERLFVELTSSCNLSCLHCYGSFAPDKFENIDIGLVENLVKEANKLGIYRIDLTGGEPLMHPNFVLIPELMDSQAMIYTVFSNLTYLPERIVSEFKRYPPLGVVTSLESKDASIHDSFRGGVNSHAKTIANISHLQDLGIPVTVNVVVGRHNIDTIWETVEWLESLKTQIVIDTIHLEGRADRSLQITNEEAFNLRMHFEPILDVASKNVSCGVAREMVYVGSDSYIRLCPSLRSDEFLLGDARHYGQLSEYLESLPAKYASFHGSRCRATCPMGAHCLSPCQARSIRHGGSPNAPDPDMCARYLRR